MSDQEYMNEVVGKVLKSVDVTNDEIVFKFTDGTVYLMSHHQDCCETVSLEDIDGDIQSLVGEKIEVFECVTNSDKPKHQYDITVIFTVESYTWTFYKIRTNKDSVTLRWYGSSNGYYSEGVSFDRLHS
jgi:hypothetical protein